MSVGVVNKQTGDRIPTAGMPAIDNALDLTSVNPVQNAVITEALAGKADTDIVADDFDATASYVSGNYCIKDGKLYRFKANHSGAWSAADVEEIQIAGELSAIKSGLTDLNGYKANRLKGSAPKNDTATVDITDLGNTIGLIVCTTYRSYALYAFKAETSNLYVQKVSDGGTYPPTISAVDADTLSIANSDTGASGQYMILT